MTPYEKIVKRMRIEGMRNNEKGMQYAEAVSSSVIKVGDTRMDKDFFTVAEHVGKIKKGDILICCKMEEDMYVVLGKVVV